MAAVRNGIRIAKSAGQSVSLLACARIQTSRLIVSHSCFRFCSSKSWVPPEKVIEWVEEPEEEKKLPSFLVREGEGWIPLAEMKLPEVKAIVG